MSSLRQAAQAALEMLLSIKRADITVQQCSVIGELEAALAEPRHKPAPIVAARYRNGDGAWTYTDKAIGSIEADGWNQVEYLCDAAPQDQQPLTDNEAFTCADGLFPRWREDIQPAFVLLLSRAIERAHGIGAKP